ncbi:MAG: hypothetical protein WBD40_14605 [Tepidisphaeraceae bacterium]
MLNQVGMPPPSRNVQRRRADVEAEMEARGEGPTPAGNQLLVSIIAFGVVVIVGLLVGWLVF